ncbi:MAG: di-trans,poly-cis-decaprenylcistransferase [Rhodobacterales bacterium 12-64-8]|nr:MAG: di-trans,poly-cis-decaprenylcistransferase [Rhodobacterales bacterium 12-64-8]OYX50358.1 MAG: di-trans,poly-cis-decaprenylcistransferase [Alphaproteobacteria bacterium 32-64-14]
MSQASTDTGDVATLRSPPRHVAIIMDGNGRWAKARGLPRALGHKEGVEALRRTVEACRDLGVAHLTVFSFSTENWNRPQTEIDALFDLLRIFVRRDLARLHKDGVRIRIVGSRDGLSEEIISLIDEAIEKTRDNTRLTLNIAFNYGGRGEIVAAMQAIAREIEAGRIKAADVNEALIARVLWTANSPDPDLVIRTSGEFRLSNFLLWSGAYAELMFMDLWWPDFTRESLEKAIDAFRRRDRRFGGLGA